MSWVGPHAIRPRNHTPGGDAFWHPLETCSAGAYIVGRARRGVGKAHMPVRLTCRAGPSLIVSKYWQGGAIIGWRLKMHWSRFGGWPPGQTHGVWGRNPTLRPV
eukprot:gene12348-biopygen22966